ncbi:type 1 fimbrial protein [Salmonella enterica]|nr:type 1 fimbrial protein [Salmonella enterica]
MKHNILSVLLLMIISPVVWAGNDVNVDLGNQTLLISQSLNSVFGQKTVTLPALCANCSNVTVKWEPLVPRLADSSASPGTYLFASGIKGIAIQINTKISGTPLSAEQPISFQVGLVKVSETVEAGTEVLSKPLLKWSLFSKKESITSSVPEKEGIITVGGTLKIGSCELGTKNLYIKLKPVSVNEINNVNIGEIVTTGSQSSQIQVKCTAGVFNSLKASFNAANTILNTDEIIEPNNNKESIGVGFILKGGDNGGNNPIQTIHWNKEPLILNVPEDGVLNYPLTAYYTPITRPVSAGEITATVNFTINYP